MTVLPKKADGREIQFLLAKLKKTPILKAKEDTQS
jgi:hypothetical protein